MCVIGALQPTNSHDLLFFSHNLELEVSSHLLSQVNKLNKHKDHCLFLYRLQRLELDLCGRGFTDRLAKTLVNKGALSNLKVLALGGAYRLSDEGLLTL